VAELRKPVGSLPIDVPSKIVAVGLNYRDHAEESGTPVPATPITFAKWPSSLLAHGEAIVLPDGIDAVDYEAELGVVIDREVRDVSAANALDCVRGYVCINDVSARRIQAQDGQWTRAKSFDTFSPVGPRLVPAAAIADPQSLGIRCRINGELLQDGHTANMVFTVAELIAFISTSTTLLPGDLIITGTPGGVGAGRTPERYLAAGDVVEVEIDGIGVLRNEVRAASAREEAA
jgi:2-keto-4-pentenoate hydratase/2-oxohepta-3-ene-1,7-dioic acid hydratase in catechol pathway